jgi:hypothetical protein
VKGPTLAHNSKYEGLPATWPFRAAGTLVIVALSWFCFGFAVKDMGEELTNHMPVFWLLMLAALLCVLGGAIYNLGHSRSRKRTAG